MAAPSTPTTQPKPRRRSPARTQTADEAAASNPMILCQQIGLCKNLAELQSFIARHALLNVETDSRFSDGMKVAIEEALDTMTEVLQNPGVETATLFPAPADLAAKNWRYERDGVVFRLRKGTLSTAGYIIRSEAAEAARKLQAREGKRAASAGTASPEAASSAEVAAHEFKPTTSRNGRCAVCNKESATDEHRAFTARQREREKAGQPKRDGAFWREQAAEMQYNLDRQLRPYDTSGKKTLRKIEEYEARVRDGLGGAQWQGTLLNLAVAVDEERLPPALYGLSNAYQVRSLLGERDFKFEPSNMGQTIKTIADLRAAAEALKPFTPELAADPNPSPREDTEWAAVVSADDAGAHAADGESAVGSTIDELGEVSSLRRATLDAGCGTDCGHTPEEHDAFDTGLIAGERGEAEDGEAACPHTDSPLRLAWLTGFEVGAGNRRTSSPPPPREVFYMVTKGRGKQLIIDLCYAPDETEHAPGDKSALIAVAEGGARRVASKRGIDKSDDEVLAWLVGDTRLIAPHDFIKSDEDEVCGVCLDVRGSLLHPISDEQLIAMLSMVDVEVDEAAVRAWTPLQRQQAEEWVTAVHVWGNDDDIAPPPPRPGFLPSTSADTTTNGDIVETPAHEPTPAPPRIFRETVEVKLNDSDIAVKARKAASIEVQIEELESELKKTKKSYEEKIGGLREEHRELMRSIVRGHDELDLEVFERRDYDRHVVETVRTDSLEVVSTRAMRPTEYQQPLPSL